MAFGFGAPKAGFGTTMSHMKQNLTHIFRKKIENTLKGHGIAIAKFQEIP
jgi:hypothetical protein